MMADKDFDMQRRLMVDRQIAARGVIDRRVLAAMKSVPRHCFVPLDELAWAYADGPLPIGHGQTISQPFIVALMTELLDLPSNSRVLEVGTGSGYQAAVLGSLAREVHTLELIPELATKAREILQDLGYTNVVVHLGDGSYGWKENAPYDGILVTAASPRIPPPLFEQLADGGRMVIPVGPPGAQSLELVKRNGDQFEYQMNIPVAFVPLRGEHGWK